MERIHRPVARMQARRAAAPRRRVTRLFTRPRLFLFASLALGAAVFAGLLAPLAAFAAAPSAPTAVVASGRYAGMWLTWTAPTNNGGSAITNYRVSIYTDAAGTVQAGGITNPQTVGSATTAFQVTGLTPGSAYSFRVEATNDGSSWSAASVVSQFTSTSANAVVASNSNASGQLAATNTVGYAAWLPKANSHSELAGKSVTGFSAGGGQASGGLKGAGCAITNDTPGASQANLYCWGQYNNSGNVGYVGDGTATGKTVPTMASNMNNKTVVAVSTTSSHTCAITSESSNNLYCWGDNSNSQLGDTTTTARSTAVKPRNSGNTADYFASKKVAQVNVGEWVTCALTEESTNNLYCWGRNNANQLGDTTTTTRSSPVRPRNSANTADYFGSVMVESVSVHISHGCATTSAPVSGTSVNAYCWGSNTNNMLGDGSSTTRTSPVALSNTNTWYSASTRATFITNGNQNGCLITSAATNNLYCWGVNSSSAGLVGDGTSTNRSTPTAVSLTGKTWANVAISKGETAATTTSTDSWACAATTEASSNLYCWGGNGNGQVGDGTGTSRAGSPTPVSFGAASSLNGIQVSTAAGRTTLSSSVYMSTYGMLGAHAKAVVIASGGLVHYWGLEQSNAFGVGTTLSLASTYPNGMFGANYQGGSVAGATITGVHGGANFTCVTTNVAVTASTTNIHCVGANGSGQLGQGNTTTYYRPMMVTGLNGKTVTGFAVANLTVCAVTTEATGNLYCWGSNTSRQGANGGFGNITAPAQIAGMSAKKTIDVAVGDGHVCALTSESTNNVYCWGSNVYGETADPSTLVSNTPAPYNVTSGTLANAAAAQIAVGADHSCALLTNGSAHCWGRNNAGQIGDVTNTDRAAPVAVSTAGASALGGKTITSISSGFFHVCALTGPGATSSIACWGYNIDGELADNSSTSRNLPVAAITTASSPASALNGKTVVSVNAGHYATCSVTSDGMAQCWGTGSSYQRGDLLNSPTTRSYPVPFQSFQGETGASAAEFSVSASANFLRTGPAVPTGLGITTTQSARTLSWAAPTNTGAVAISDYSVQYATSYTGPWTTYNDGVSATTSASLSGLPAGALYYRVAAVSAEGTGAYTLPLGTPGAPTGVTASAGDASATVSWVAPADTGASAITSYEVTAYTDAGGTAAAVGMTNPQTLSSGGSFTGLTAGTTYSFRVAAVNANGAGELSDVTSEVVPYTTPQAMAAPSVTAGSSSASVSFIAVTPSSAAAGYTTLAATPYSATCTSNDGGASGSATGATSPITVPSLTSGKNYTCAMTVTNSANLTSGASPASSPAVLVFGPPPTPAAPDVTTKADQAGALEATFTTFASYDAGFGYAAAGAPPYSIECVSVNGGASATTTGSSSPIVVTALTPGSNYHCRLTVTNANAESATSAWSAGYDQPYTTPGVPTGLSAVAGPSTAAVAWTAPGGTGSVGAGYTSISSYEVQAYSDAGGTTTVGAAQTLASGGTFTGLTPGTEYWFRVRAINSVGAGSWSAVDPSVADTPDSVLPYGTPATPAAVTLATKADTAGALTATFGAPAAYSAEAGYTTLHATTPYRVDCTSGDGGTSGYATGATTTIHVTALTPGKTYTCTLKVTNSADFESSASAASNSATPYDLPGAPTAVAAVAGAADVTVGWTAPGGSGTVGAGYTSLTDYRIYAYTNAAGTTLATGMTNPQLVGSGNAVNGTFSGISSGTTYYYRVAAQNSVGWGPLSDVSNGAPKLPDQMAAPTATGGLFSVEVAFSAVTPSSSEAGYAPLANPAYAATCTSSDGGTQGSATGNASPITVSSLSAGKTYTCTTIVTNAWNLPSPASPASNAVTTFAVPGKPTAVTATRTASQTVEVGFTAPASDGGSAILDYTVQYTTAAASPGVASGTWGTTVGTLTDLASPITVTGLTNGTTYYFRVFATNAVGDGAASDPSYPSATPYTTPGSPTITSVTAGELEASLAWSAPASDGGESIDDYLVSAYEIVAGIPVPSGAPVSMGSGATLSYTYTGLVKCTSYAFRVAAVNAAGTGASSAQSATVIPYDEADAPQDLFGLPGESLVVVGWTAPATDGCSEITSYSVQYRESGAEAWETLAPGVGTSVRAEIASLTNDTDYEVQVAAVNAAGTSAYQSLSEYVDNAWVPTPITPTGSSPMVTVSGTTAAVTWSGGVNVSEVLGRYRSPASSGSWNGAPTTVTSPWAISGLTAGSTFDVELYAKTGGCSAPSTCPVVSVQNIQTLTAPTDLAGNYSAGATALTWTFSPNATGYVIYRHNADDAANATSVGTSATASFSDVVNSAETLYYWTSATLSGSHWSVESAKSSGVAVVMASAPSFSAISSGGAVLQPTETITLGATVNATGGMDTGTITLCVVQGSSQANAESTCATDEAGDAVTAARWELTMDGSAILTADAANTNEGSTWNINLTDEPASGEWTSSSAWDFSALVTIGKAARASSDNWYVVIIGENSAGTTTSTVGPKSMGSYFELGSVASVNWGQVTPGLVEVTAAYDPNGQPIPIASASENESRAVSGIWGNTVWGLTSSISSFASADGWELNVAATDQAVKHGEFAMGCSAEPGGLTLDSANFLGLTAKNITGASNEDALATDSAASVTLDCQLFNGSAKAATYSGTVIIGIGPGEAP